MANPLCHWELMVTDLAKARQFYGRVFDWRFDDGMSQDYIMVQTGGVGGGMMTKPPGAPMPALNTYFQVDDINETLRRVVEAGGSVIVPKTEIPPGWFAMFLDIDRIPVGIVEEKKAASAPG